MPGDKSLHVVIERRAYSGRAILGRIAFEAAPGEVLALLAPSGTGKTTALRIVLGLDRDFAGSVTRPEGPAGAMFQEPRLLPWLDVAGNLRLVAPGLDDSGIAALLAASGLAGFGVAAAARAVAGHGAAGGAGAGAWPCGPGCWCSTSLSPRWTRFWERDWRPPRRMRRADMGATVLMATHDLEQALAVADRILVLAGTPACLAADLVCPEPGERAGFARSLRERFAFMAGSAQEKLGLKRSLRGLGFSALAAIMSNRARPAGTKRISRVLSRERRATLLDKAGSSASSVSAWR